MAVDLFFSGAPGDEDLIFGDGAPITDLLFEDAPGGTDLVFGGEGVPTAQNAVLTIDGVLPNFVGGGRIRQGRYVAVTGLLPNFVGGGAVLYSSGANRFTVAQTEATWEVAVPQSATAGGEWQTAHPVAQQTAAPWQEGLQAVAGVSVANQSAVGMPNDAEIVWQEAAPLQTKTIEFHEQDGVPTPKDRTVVWQEAAPLQTKTVEFKEQDGVPTRKAAAAIWQNARVLSREFDTTFQKALAFSKVWGGRYQEAWPPRPGHRIKPGPPQPQPCYVPPLGGDVRLVFEEAWTSSLNLVFSCETHGPTPPVATVVVPVRRVYVVQNNVVLRRVEGDVLIPAAQLSLSLDVDSWAWSGSASVDGRYLSLVSPNVDGDPVELEATINSVPYRLLVEAISRDRSFNDSTMRLAMRGKTALLDAPYAPTLSFGNPDDDRTAQQLMGDVLTINGVPLGWDVYWGLDDWSVPTGVFSHQGTYISALTTIAAAAGAYIRPHRTDEVISVLPRYPAAPWDWGTVTPDFELPADVVTQEGIEWVNRPIYNRVWVSGQGQGVLGRVTRAGTDGGLLAPMITDPLITHADAARQRGLPVLAETGRMANVSLRLPVLSETGIIVPGSFVRYVDSTTSTTRIGLARSVAVSSGAFGVDLRQTIALETHE